MRRIMILALIVAIGFGLRLFKIDTTPPGISHDELEFVNNGYAMVKTGHDLYDKAMPFVVGNNGHVGLPAYFSGVTSLIFGLHIWSVRLLPAIMGTIEILLIFGICLELFRNFKISLWAAAIFAISPWSLKIARGMFDPPLALFLFLAGIFVFLSGKSIKTQVMGITFLSLGFLSYYGALFFFPFVITGLIWYRRKEITNKKSFLMIIGFIELITAGIYLAGILNGQSGRTNELIFNLPKISAEVVFNSFTSNAPAWSNRMFVNKFTVLGHTFLRNYLDAFSLRMMFVDGDPNRIYGLWDRGELELYLLPPIFIGAITAYLRYRRQLYLLVLLIIVAPLTAGVSGTVYATRAFLLWPALIITGAVGMHKIWEKWPKFRIVCLGIMIYSLFGTAHQYFYRYPVYAAEMWFDSERQLAEYLTTRSEEIDIYGPENRQMFMEYFFYAKGDPETAQAALTKNNSIRAIKYQNLNFIQGCPSKEAAKTIQIAHYSCGPDKTYFYPLVTTRDKSNRVIWYMAAPNI